jgi:hypothetical protein
MTHAKENEMKHGHVTGHKKERSGKGRNWWYHTPEAEEIIRKLDAEWEVTGCEFCKWS